MVLDNHALFSDKQAITVSAASTNHYDLGETGKIAYNSAGTSPVSLKRNLGKAKKIPLLIQVTEDFATLTSLTIEVQVDDNTNFSSPKTVVSQVVPVASLKKGLILNIDCVPRGVDERFLRLYYTVTGTTATAGKITAGIVAAVDGAYKG